MSKTEVSHRKIPNYNFFQIFYGYPWQSNFFNRDLLKKLMDAVKKECERKIQKQYQQQVFIEITDLKLKAGGFLLLQLEQQIDKACIGIFEISDQNPNVFLELGHMKGARKNILVLKENTSQTITDLEGIVEIRYDKTNLEAVVPQLVVEICKLIHEIRDDFQWESFLWEGMQRFPTKIYLGWTTPEFPDHNKPFGFGHLSTGDVQVMDMLRQRFPATNQERLNLVTHVTEFAGDELSANIISIGGPRRNSCTAAILNLPEIKKRTNYEFVGCKPKADGFEEYFIRAKGEKGGEYHTDLRIPMHTEHKHLNGDDFGLIYKLTAPGGEPVYTWIILAGITREGTLACLDCLFGSKKIQKSIIDHSLEGKDTEILIRAKVIDGKHLSNPFAIDIKPIEKL